MMRLTFVCRKCSAKVRREVRSKGNHEVNPDVRCPKGHGLMVREDGMGVERKHSR